jgi:hypothetical protein
MKILPGLNEDSRHKLRESAEAEYDDTQDDMVPTVQAVEAGYPVKLLQGCQRRISSFLRARVFWSSSSQRLPHKPAQSELENNESVL